METAQISVQASMQTRMAGIQQNFEAIFKDNVNPVCENLMKSKSK